MIINKLRNYSANNNQKQNKVSNHKHQMKNHQTKTNQSCNNPMDLQATKKNLHMDLSPKPCMQAPTSSQKKLPKTKQM